jgi:hypothetical protein
MGPDLCIGTESAQPDLEDTKREVMMNPIIKELASINLFIILMVVFGAFAFLRVVKNILEV